MYDACFRSLYTTPEKHNSPIMYLDRYTHIMTPQYPSMLCCVITLILAKGEVTYYWVAGSKFQHSSLKHLLMKCFARYAESFTCSCIKIAETDMSTQKKTISCLIAKAVVLPWPSKQCYLSWLVADKSRVMHVLSHIVCRKMYINLMIVILFTNIILQCQDQIHKVHF